MLGLLVRREPRAACSSHAHSAVCLRSHRVLLQEMFLGSLKFNQDLDWDTSSVTDMSVRDSLPSYMIHPPLPYPHVCFPLPFESAHRRGKSRCC